ncbi:hypothetical protein KIH24_01140 [Rhizobiales bacterium TNE-4]|nr:hypothetical protein [Rhizobiales bacterium TNE-4]MBV1826221.1 hypothetical protein [Rhizobiales bacterium TNE-4]
MSVLKSLNFLSPSEEAKTPLDRARSKLIDNLNQQIALSEDRQQFKVRRHWKIVDGEKQLIERKIPIRPWWEEKTDGQIHLRIRNGVRILEIEKGKPTIRAKDLTEMREILMMLANATKNHEIDNLLTPKQHSFNVSKSKQNTG